MQMTFRKYRPEGLFGGDYGKVRGFLISINRDGLFYPHLVWGRWEWMVTHAMLDRAALRRIGIWEINGEAKGIALFDCELGKAYICTSADASNLKDEMLDYAAGNLSKDGKCKILIDNGDKAFQYLAR